MATQLDLGSGCQKAFCAVKAQEKLSPGPSPDPNITERVRESERATDRPKSHTHSIPTTYTINKPFVCSHVEVKLT